MKQFLSLLLALLALFALRPAIAQQTFTEFPSLWTGHGNSRNWVDVDGDGKDDFCTLYDSRETLVCFRSLGNRFETSPSIVVNIRYPAGNKGGADPRIQWVDINGDGHVDLCRRPGIVAGALVNAYPAKFICNYGPSFASLNITLDVSYWFTEHSGVVGDSWYLQDVNEDGQQDVCYQYADYGSASGTEEAGGMSPTMSIRCQLNRGTSFDTPYILIQGYAPDETELTRSKAGFHDFNGDGRADFCNRSGCYVRTATGFDNYISFAATATRWSNGEEYGWEGATFVDFNGDGKIDFCGPTTWGRLICLLSNGKNDVRTPVYSSNLDGGYKYWRWWVDINSDGYPDYCRAVGSNIDGRRGWYDNWGTMRCRLGLGDSFAREDIVIDSFNFGKPDGGRGFCDPAGTGIQTFCRAIKRAVSGEAVCTPPDENNEGGCYTPVTDMEGVQTGLVSGHGPNLPFVPQAEQPLLKSYSDGLGAETRLSYLPLTNGRVYRRSTWGPSTPELSVVLPRQLVVSETRAWLKEPGELEEKWKPLTGNATYVVAPAKPHEPAWMLAMRGDSRW